MLAAGRPVVQSAILTTGQAVVSAGRISLTAAPPNSPFRGKRFPQLPGTASTSETVSRAGATLSRRGPAVTWAHCPPPCSWRAGINGN